VTKQGASIAAAFKSTYPSPEDHKNASPVELEAMRRQWGICLGGTAEALESLGLLHDRIAFYRLAGLAIYD
jgi:hypothetical protein